MTEHLDEAIFHPYKAINDGLLPLRSLRQVPDVDKQRDAFFCDDGNANPDLTPHLDVAEVQARKISFKALKTYLKESDSFEPVVRTAYEPVLSDAVSTCDLLEAAHMGDVDAFREANHTLYGEVDQAIFDFCLDFFGQQVDAARNSKNVFVRDAAARASEVLPEPKSHVQSVWPNQKQFRSTKRQFTTFFEPLFEGVEIPSTVSSEQTPPILRQMLDNIGLSDFTPTFRENADVSTMVTVESEKKIWVPLNQEYDRNRFTGLASHEIGIHAAEYKNAMEQQLLLLSEGLHGALVAGEGKGVLVEELVYPNLAAFMDTKRFNDILRRYLAIGLSVGTDGGGERTFKEVFAIIHSVDRLWELEHNSDDPVSAGTNALNRTWELLSQRTNKGPVGKGSSHTKDKLYVEGNLQQWGLLTRLPEVYPYLNLGKYDLADKEQIPILQDAHVIPRSIGRALLHTA